MTECVCGHLRADHVATRISVKPVVEADECHCGCRGFLEDAGDVETVRPDWSDLWAAWGWVM